MFDRKPPAELAAPDAIRDQAVIRFYLSVVTCFSIVALRDPSALWRPPIPSEDGLAIFSHYYNVTSIVPPVRYWGGYISLGSDIVGYMVSYFPTRWEPHLLAGIPMFTTAIAFSLFALPMFRPIVQSDRQRFLIGIGLALMPFGNYATVGLTGYIQWPAGIILVLLVLARPSLPLMTLRGLGLSLFLSVLVWTNPISVLAIPFFLHASWSMRSLAYLLLVAACILYLFYGRTLEPTNVHIVRGAMESTRLLLERGIFETAFGTAARMWFLTNLPWIALDIAGVATAGLVLFALKERISTSSEFRFFILAGATLSAGICLLPALASRPNNLEIEFGQRYSYIPAAVFAIWMGVAFTDVFARLKHERRAALCGIAGLALISTNFFNNWLYRTPQQLWPPLDAFLDQVVATERSGVTATLRLDGPERAGWQIILHVRPRQ